MEAIGVITSRSTLVEKVDHKTGEKHQLEIMAWNATVANLTLMALGSSAPEILLSVIEIVTSSPSPCFSGALGPLSDRRGTPPTPQTFEPRSERQRL